MFYAFLDIVMAPGVRTMRVAGNSDALWSGLGVRWALGLFTENEAASMLLLGKHVRRPNSGYRFRHLWRRATTNRR